jgi:hypothetical protein
MAIPNCARCRNRRGIISENGFHYVCGLSWKKARDCILGIRKHYFELPKFAWGAEDGNQ